MRVRWGTSDERGAGLGGSHPLRLAQNAAAFPGAAFTSAADRGGGQSGGPRAQGASCRGAGGSAVVARMHEVRRLLPAKGVGLPQDVWVR